MREENSLEGVVCPVPPLFNVRHSTLTFFFSDRNVFGTHPAHISSFWDCFPLCIRDSNVKLAVRRYLFLELRIC